MNAEQQKRKSMAEAGLLVPKTEEMEEMDIPPDRVTVFDLVIHEMIRKPYAPDSYFEELKHGGRIRNYPCQACLGPWPKETRKKTKEDIRVQMGMSKWMYDLLIDTCPKHYQGPGREKMLEQFAKDKEEEARRKQFFQQARFTGTPEVKQEVQEEGEKDKDVPSTSNVVKTSLKTEKAPKLQKTPKKVYTCPDCQKSVGNSSIKCTGCEEWIHFKCAGITRLTTSLPNFKCGGCKVKGTAGPKKPVETSSVAEDVGVQKTPEKTRKRARQETETSGSPSCSKSPAAKKRKEQKKEKEMEKSTKEQNKEKEMEKSTKEQKKEKEMKKSSKMEKKMENSPKKEKKKKYTCPKCNKSSHKGSMLCHGCNEWFHLKCQGMRVADVPGQWKCAPCSQLF